MAEPQREFKAVSRLNVEAIGVPGQRTFRILAEGGGSSAALWLEKEQLFQLALAIRQLILASSPKEDPSPHPEDIHGGDLELKVGKMSLGQDATTGKFVIEAYDAEMDEADLEGPATLRIWATRSQTESLAEEAFEVCAAGRPLCLLCGGPIDPTGHICPRSNGHREPSDL